MIEIKYRGPLTKDQLRDLSNYLIQKGNLIESSYEKVIFFDTSIFPEIGDFITGFSRLSLKLNKQKATLRIKEGNPSTPKRNEIAIDIKTRHCSNLVYILNCLGLKYGFYRPAYRETFQLGNIRVSIKTKCVMGDHFEIELTKGTSIKHPRFVKLLNECSIALWTEKKYQERINLMMKKFPALNVYDSKMWEDLGNEFF